MRAMVLLNQVTWVLDLPQLTTFREDSGCFEFLEGFGISRVFINVDDPWFTCMRGGKRFQQEVFSGLRISRRAQKEIERMTLRIDRSVQIHPLLFDLDVGHRPI